MGNGPAHVAKTGRFLSNWQRSKSEILALTSDFRRSAANGALPMLLLQLPKLWFVPLRHCVCFAALRGKWFHAKGAKEDAKTQRS